MGVVILKDTKQCTECGQVKDVKEFHKVEHWRRNICIICYREYKRKYHRHYCMGFVYNNIDGKTTKKCERCGQWRNVKEFEDSKGHYYRKICLECRSCKKENRYGHKPKPINIFNPKKLISDEEFETNMKFLLNYQNYCNHRMKIGTDEPSHSLSHSAEVYILDSEF